MFEKISQDINDDGNQSLSPNVDWLPLSIRQSSILNTDNPKQLAGVNEIPFIDPAFHHDRLKNIIQYYSINPDEMEMELHIYAKELLDKSKVSEAWQVLLTGL